jgi:sec-independent protein translocase protein TatA
MRGLFEGWHLIILVALIALLFGSKRLPDAARGLGKSMRILKSEVREMKEEDHRPSSSPSTRPEALEGRVVEPEAERTGTASERRTDV